MNVRCWTTPSQIGNCRSFHLKDKLNMALSRLLLALLLYFGGLFRYSSKSSLRIKITLFHWNRALLWGSKTPCQLQLRIWKSNPNLNIPLWSLQKNHFGQWPFKHYIITWSTWGSRLMIPFFSKSSSALFTTSCATWSSDLVTMGHTFHQWFPLRCFILSSYPSVGRVCWNGTSIFWLP